MPKFSSKLLFTILGLSFLCQAMLSLPNSGLNFLGTSQENAAEKSPSDSKALERKIAKLEKRLVKLKAGLIELKEEEQKALKAKQKKASIEAPLLDPVHKSETTAKAVTKDKLDSLEASKTDSSEGEPLPEFDKNQSLGEVSWSPRKEHLDDPFFGSGDKLIMAFLDFECAPCRSFLRRTLPSLRAEAANKSYKLIVRDYPLKKNPAARRLAQSVACAGEQGRYWEALEEVAEYPDVLSEGLILGWANGIATKKNSDFEMSRFRECLKSRRYRGEIDRDIEEGKRLGIIGAPGFFIGKKQTSGNYQGYFLRGAQPNRVFSLLLERLDKTG